MSTHSSSEKAYNELLRLHKVALAKKDPWVFLSEFVITKDEHDKNSSEKKFPNHRYLRYLTRLWQRNRLMIVPKSRQVMMSWLFIALYLWDTMYHRGRNNFFQRIKEDDSIELMNRAKFIYDRLPKELQIKDAKWSLSGKTTFPSIGSKITSIPQGAHQLRGETASGILSDEMAFQEENDEAYFAAKPSIDGGGRYTCVTTPNGQDFVYYLVHDIEDQWRGYE